MSRLLDWLMERFVRISDMFDVAQDWDEEDE